MKRDFGTRRITLVLAPVDMRFGYAALSRFAQERLFLDPDGGTDVVVFVGRHRKTAKVIWADENGGGSASAEEIRPLHNLARVSDQHEFHS